LTKVQDISHIPLSGLIPTIQQGASGKPPPALTLIHLRVRLLVLLLLPVPRVLPLAADLPRHVVVVVVEVVAEGWVPAWPTGLRHSSPCAGTLLRMSMRWLDVSGRLTTTYVVKLPLWVLPSPPPRSPDVPLHPPPPEINEWYQQAYGVPFMTADDVDEEEEAYFDDREQFVPPPYHGDLGQSSSHPPPQDPSGSAPPPDQSGEEHFASHLARHLFAPHPPPNW
jgi:hypothetical protein